VWKNGTLQTQENNSNKSYLPWIIGGIVFVIILIPYLFWRHKKIKEIKKTGKKVPWWY
jgi:hypothetical protein